MNATRPLTNKMDLIRTLLIELGEASTEGRKQAEIARRQMNYARFELQEWDHEVASRWITRLIATKRTVVADERNRLAELNSRPVEARPEVPTNRYAITGADGSTDFYLVTNEKGHYSVKLYISDSLNQVAWRQALSVLKRIEADGIEEARLRFAREGKRCTNCNRRLTDENNPYFHMGLGPDCGKRA